MSERPESKGIGTYELSLAEARKRIHALEANCAAMRQAVSDFVLNVKHAHVAGWGDVSRDTVADNSFQELQKSLDSESGKSIIGRIHALEEDSETLSHNVTESHKRIHALEEGLRSAKEDIEYIGCHTRHPYETPCQVCQRVDKQVDRISSILGGSK